MFSSRFLLADLGSRASANVGRGENRQDLGSTLLTLLSCGVRVAVLLIDRKPQINKPGTKLLEVPSLGITKGCDRNDQGESYISCQVWVCSEIAHLTVIRNDC